MMNTLWGLITILLFFHNQPLAIEIIFVFTLKVPKVFAGFCLFVFVLL